MADDNPRSKTDTYDDTGEHIEEIDDEELEEVIEYIRTEAVEKGEKDEKAEPEIKVELQSAGTEEMISDVKEYFETTEPIAEEWGVPDDSFIEERFFDFTYLEDYTEIERYWLRKPYSFVSILQDEEKEMVYYIVEPELDEFESYVRRDVTEMLRDVLMYVDLGKGEERRDKFDEKLRETIADYSRKIDDGSLHKIYYYLNRDFVNFGKIDPIMNDRNIEDISCDGTDIPIYIYHGSYRDIKTNVRFEKEELLNSFIIRLAQRCGKHISLSNPLVDASLPGGSRIQLTLGSDISTRGSNFTIRKFSDEPITPIDLINWNTFSIDEMAYFWLAIENNKSLMFVGGTGCGKTTSMNAASFFIPPGAKVVTIEDTREIILPHENWIQSVTRQPFAVGERGRVDMYDLLQAALRQRPEYLLVGEIRAQHEVALTFFQAMSTGHTSYTTFHAESVETVINRLENEPLNVPRRMIESLDIISIQKQIVLTDKRIRRAEEIVEIVENPDGERVLTNTVFEWNPSTDTHNKGKKSVVLEEIRESHGWTEEELEDRLNRRREVLEYLVENEVTDYMNVAKTIKRFAKDPDVVLEQMHDDAFYPEEMADDEIPEPEELEPEEA